jgi:cell division protein FtsW (lipid II flippase)
MAINETKITFFLFPVLILFLLRKYLLKKQSLKSVFAIVLFSGVIFISSYFAYNYLYRELRIFDYNFTANYVSREYTKSGSLNRIPQIEFAHRNIIKDIYTAFLGVGPGNASDSFFEKGVGYYYRKYPILKIDSVFLGRFIWEYGYLGLAIFLYILFRLFGLAEKICNNSPDPFYKSLALGFEGMMFILVVAAVYSNSFIIDSIGYVFWFMAGYLQRIASASHSEG